MAYKKQEKILIEQKLLGISKFGIITRGSIQSSKDCHQKMGSLTLIIMGTLNGVILKMR